MELKQQYKALIESLKLLASPYEKQASYLPGFTNIKDEVISTFADAFLLLPQLIENDLLSRQAIAATIRCFNWMEMCERDNSISDTASFKQHENWQKVRLFAAKVLNAMNEDNGKPDLSHIEWVD